MKPVFIIAIVAVAMIGVMVPSVFADYSEIISNFDLQKKLNEYWYCTVELGYSNQDCVKHDEKHTVGISPTEIANYQIEKDDTLTFTYEDSDISTKLETFRDQSLHQDLWDIYTSITPPEILSEVVYFVVYTDDYAGAESASVQRDPDNFLKFDLFVDPVDMVPSGIKIDKQYYISTLIHENAHILSLDASQSDNKPMSDDAGNSPDMYIQEMKNGERSCALNYYNDLAGCMNQNSYLNAFFQKFWAGIYHDFKWELEFDDYETFYEHNTEFYFKYEKYWLTEYSSANPDEDFAESFMAFVLKEKPSAPTFAEQKILFFYQYPELVEMRDFTRSAIATSEFCDNGTVWIGTKCLHVVTKSTGNQMFENQELGISFNVPEGWALQQPDKNATPGAPDVAVVGPKIDGVNPVISLTITNEGDKTIDDLITEKSNTLAEAVYLNKLEILSQEKINSNVYQTEAIGNFELNDMALQIKFLEVMILLEQKSYTFAYSNTVDNFDNHLPKFQELLDSFQISSQENSIVKTSEATPEAIPEAIPQQSQGGGCLIATATYGSEMATEVQQLREIRDNQLMNTESGSAFMSGFNELYYSFSPTIADMERENPMFKEAVKLGLTPMLSSLAIMENADSESEVLGLGLSVIALNLGMYLGVPAIVIIGIRKKF